MSQIEIIEQNIRQLSPGELKAFRAWFLEFDATEWDRQPATDSDNGKLDRLSQSAIEEHRAGKTKLIGNTLHRRPSSNVTGNCRKAFKSLPTLISRC